jgi:putative spermidine/putrescine transport system substrate-binding protein
MIRLKAFAMAVTATIAAAVVLPVMPVAAADYLSMPWDKVMEAAKTDGEIVFYSWWGEEYWTEAAKDFETETGIKVKTIIGDRPANIAKVAAEASSAAGTIDVLHSGGVEIKLLLDSNVLYGPLKGAFPNSDKLDAKLFAMQEGFATNGYLAPEYRNQTGFLYDPEKLPNPPQTWAEFTKWLDANPGQFAFNDPTKGGSGQAFIQTVLLNLLGETPDKYLGDTELNTSKITDWGKAWEWLNTNESKFVITASNNDSIDRVNQGEVTMAAAWDDDTQVALGKGTLFKRAKLYVPEMGMPGGGDTLAIPANAPRKAAALAFINFLTSPEQQKKMNATIGAYLARTDISSESSLLPEAERQQNGKPWLPGPYKKHYIEQFVAEVLQK